MHIIYAPFVSGLGIYVQSHLAIIDGQNQGDLVHYSQWSTMVDISNNLGSKNSMRGCEVGFVDTNCALSLRYQKKKCCVQMLENQVHKVLPESVPLLLGSNLGLRSKKDGV